MSIQRNVLPSSVQPTIYDLHIEPDFTTFTFRGKVCIHVTAHEAVNKITLNADKLEYQDVAFSAAEINSGAPVPIAVTSLQHDAENQRLTCPLPGAFHGEGNLTITYTGLITSNLFAFYRSRCLDGETVKHLGATQLCPVDARKVLPCWDEPSIKAVFRVTLITDASMLALSNCPVESQEEMPNGKTRWTFSPTPKMSSYLLAWVVGELEYIEESIPKTHAVTSNEGDDHSFGGAASSTVIRVYATKGKAEKGRFALEVARRVIPLYEEVFGSNYVLPKLDMIAMPDFAFGAMENWGLILYREEALIADAEMTAEEQNRIAIVVAHEIAHQWFGNLVTFDWWKGLWLNESFATYVATWAVHRLFPEWKSDVQYVFDEGTRAFQLDALRSSHPIEVDLRNAQEIDGIFDAISYAKGGTIIRMIVEFIGEEAFEKGIKVYLNKYRFGNAGTDDLWRELGLAAGCDLSTMMKEWIYHQGYPYLSASYDSATGDLHVRQRRFLVSNNAGADDDQIIWKVPIVCTCFGAGDGAVHRGVMSSKEWTMPLPAGQRVKVNANQTAFCRVLYSSEMLQELLHGVAHAQLGEIDRLSLISDYAAFALGGYCKTHEAMQLMMSYVNESSFTVWKQVSTFQGALSGIIHNAGEDVVERYRKLCQSLFQPALEALGFSHSPSDSHTTRLLRALLFEKAVSSGVPGAVKYAEQLFHNRNEAPIPADYLRAVYSNYIRTAGEPAVEEVIQLCSACTNGTHRSAMLGSLGSVTDAERMVPRLFNFLLSDAVRTQDTLYLFGALAKSPTTSSLFVKQLIQHKDSIFEKLPGMMAARLLKLVEFNSDAALLPSLEAFFGSLPETLQSSTAMSFRQGMEALKCNAEWAARDIADITTFLGN